jgi:hypothetical protein
VTARRKWSEYTWLLVPELLYVYPPLPEALEPEAPEPAEPVEAEESLVMVGDEDACAIGTIVKVEFQNRVVKVECESDKLVRFNRSCLYTQSVRHVPTGNH